MSLIHQINAKKGAKEKEEEDKMGEDVQLFPLFLLYIESIGK